MKGGGWVWGWGLEEGTYKELMFKACLLISGIPLRQFMQPFCKAGRWNLCVSAHQGFQNGIVNEEVLLLWA